MTSINKIIIANIFAIICTSNCNVGIANNADSKYVKASIATNLYEFSIAADIKELQEGTIKQNQGKAQSNQWCLARNLALGYYLTDNSRVELMRSLSPNSNVDASDSSDFLKISLKSY